VRRRITFQLKKAQAKNHILEGMMKALTIIDQIVDIVKGSKDGVVAKDTLMSKYSFSPEQVNSI
jgi:DNA gyrase/topoisomerase IV subunit A